MVKANGLETMIVVIIYIVLFFTTLTGAWVEIDGEPLEGLLLLLRDPGSLNSIELSVYVATLLIIFGAITGFLYLIADVRRPLLKKDLLLVMVVFHIGAVVLFAVGLLVSDPVVLAGRETPLGWTGPSFGFYSGLVLAVVVASEYYDLVKNSRSARPRL